MYLAVRQVDLSEAARALTDVRPWWLLLAVAVYLCGFPIRALRWRRILRNQKVLSLSAVMVPVLVGHMANNILPARTGEIYRAHFLGRRVRMSRSGALGSIVVERALDGLMLVGMMLLLFFLFPGAGLLGGAALFTGLVFVSLIAGIVLYCVATDRVHRIAGWLLVLMPGYFKKLVGRRIGAFLEGLRGVSTFEGWLKTGALTVGVWACELGAVTLVIVSFGLTLPLGGYLLVFALASLGTTLPSGPAYIGPYQYAFVLGLGFFAVSRETALAVSVAAHLSLLGSVTVIGLVLLWREQLRTGLAGHE